MSDNPVDVISVDFDKKIVVVSRDQDFESGERGESYVRLLLKSLGEDRDRLLGGSFTVKVRS